MARSTGASFSQSLAIKPIDMIDMIDIIAMIVMIDRGGVGK